MADTEKLIEELDIRIHDHYCTPECRIPEEPESDVAGWLREFAAAVREGAHEDRPGI